MKKLFSKAGILSILGAFLISGSVFAEQPVHVPPQALDPAAETNKDAPVSMPDNLPKVKQELNISEEIEGEDAPIVLSSGRSLTEAKNTIKQLDAESRKEVLTKDEREILKEAKKNLKEIRVKGNQNKSTNSLDGGTFTTLATSYNNAYTGSQSSHGDILLAYHENAEAWCAYGSLSYCHAGIFDKAKYYDETSKAIRTANTDIGMKYESPRYWRGSTFVREMRVWGTTSDMRSNAVEYARGYSGPYEFSWKYSNSSWYCSKVPFRAYRSATLRSIDANDGYFVTPADIRWSANTLTNKIYY